MRTLTLVETAAPVRTLSLARTAPIMTTASPKASVLRRLAERIARWKWPGEATPVPALGRAIDEAFESLARESRT